MDGIFDLVEGIINSYDFQALLVKKMQVNYSVETKDLKKSLKIIEDIVNSLTFDDLILFQKIWSTINQALKNSIKNPKILKNLENLLKILKLKLEFFQPFSFDSSKGGSFQELFQIFLKLRNLCLPINNTKLLVCLQEFYRTKKIWKDLHEKELGIFIDLMMENKNSENISLEAKILISKIFNKVPGSVDPSLITSINLAGNIDKIELGNFIKQSDWKKGNILVQNVILISQNNRIPCLLFKKFQKKEINIEKILQKAEKIKEINLVAQGNIVKIFAYYNSSTYFKVKVKIVENFELLKVDKHFNQNHEFFSSESFFENIRSLENSIQNIKKINLMPKFLSLDYFALKDNYIKFINIYKNPKKLDFYYCCPSLKGLISWILTSFAIYSDRKI